MAWVSWSWVCASFSDFFDFLPSFVFVVLDRFRFLSEPTTSKPSTTTLTRFPTFAVLAFLTSFRTSTPVSSKSYLLEFLNFLTVLRPTTVGEETGVSSVGEGASRIGAGGKVGASFLLFLVSLLAGAGLATATSDGF